MFSEKIHRYLYLFGIFGLAFGVTLGAVPTSVPEIILLGNWLIELNFKNKWQQLKSNKIFWAIVSVYLLHFIGLLYSNDLKAAWDDLLIKFPLLLLPMVFFSAKPLSLKEFYGLLQCFLLGSLFSTAWCLVYNFILHHNEVVRNVSRFMSHIRLGLYINMAIAISIYFVFKTQGFIKKTGFLLLAFYFVAVLVLLGLASGLMYCFILISGALFYVIYKQGMIVKLSATVLLIGLAWFVTDYIKDIKNEQLELKPGAYNEKQQKSLAGNLYLHFDTLGQKENGNKVLMNIQLEELQRSWKRLAPADSFDYGKAHHLKRYEVLVRYLSSKSLSKDSAGIAQLSETDIHNIKHDVTNYKYPEWNYLHQRVYELVNEYDEFQNNRQINGHSLTMRLYFWKAALHIIKSHWLIGIGGGDTQTELNKTYVETHSPLEPAWYKRPHNQFLSFMVSYGLIGLIIFLGSIFYPIVKLRDTLPKLFWPFFVLAMTSFILEDTLETQAGVTFYAFFLALFMSVAFFRRGLGLVGKTK